VWGGFTTPHHKNKLFAKPRSGVRNNLHTGLMKRNL
jgi:hypothetical protein